MVVLLLDTDDELLDDTILGLSSCDFLLLDELPESLNFSLAAEAPLNTVDLILSPAGVIFDIILLPADLTGFSIFPIGLVILELLLSNELPFALILLGAP